MNKVIKFIDLSLRPSILNYKINITIKKNIKNNNFIMGEDVYHLESKLKKICNVNYVVTCSSGTDALVMSLMSLYIKKDDIVFVPSFTFTSTAESVVLVGGRPFFVDVLSGSFNINPVSLENGIKKAKSANLNIKCIIVVDLFGQPCDFDSIKLISKKYKIPIIVDAAQSFGGSYKGQMVGSMGVLTTTSFFPTKPLGCFGDGGAIFTNDEKIYNTLCSIRNHGKGKNAYDNVRIGLNGRLDTLQASILLEKLKFLDKEIKMRQETAAFYYKYLKNYVITPTVPKYIKSVWSQYTLILKNEIQRDKLKFYLDEKLIKTNIYYPIPLHSQAAYVCYPRTSKVLSISEKLSKNIINLPIYPYLNMSNKIKIILAVLTFFKKYN